MMRLYAYWRSSCSWRVRLALAIKEVEHVVVPVHLVKDGGEQHGGAYIAKNPMAQVPLLEIDEAPLGSPLGEGSTVHRIAQSMAILAFLEERYPEPALLPEDIYARARARELAELVSSGIQPLQNLGVLQHLSEQLGQDSKAWSQRWIMRGLVAFEEASRGLRGRYSVGDELSWADLCLIPQMYNARRFGVDLTRVPALVDIERRCAELPAFQRAHPDAQPDAPAS
ncbi:maleylacetoacetate isomerase [Haliangium ochraceum]|uniref:Maleylacetoacetate isomerase n=1 Tax=Haliangium ochraceum (strain DSM 14365 / JCM 11303 / SMP-2) TaxID=502025 RepID=D0LRN0_HALO1|nr:maleylacetoacetate isomerase [Haliangium ochraceum]ACY19022.1 maleylacetoacetate isomerase [Haliangium ochraceum DSM 14365]